MYIVLPLLDTSTPIHTLHINHRHIQYTSTHIFGYARWAWCLWLWCIWTYVCVCVIVYECEVCINWPKQTPETLLHVLHSQKCSDFNDYKLCLCFENYYFEWQVFLFEWISISHENSAVMYVHLYYGWCHQGETQLHAVVGCVCWLLCPYSICFIRFFC